jgi:hypothetical protein
MNAGIKEDILQNAITQSGNTLLGCQKRLHRQILGSTPKNIFEVLFIKGIVEWRNTTQTTLMVLVVERTLVGADTAVHGNGKDKTAAIIEPNQ